jgi:hypothetical protein
MKLGEIVKVKGTDTKAKIVGINLFEKQPNRYVRIYKLRALNTAKWRVDTIPKGKVFTAGAEFLSKR